MVSVINCKPKMSHRCGFYSFRFQSRIWCLCVIISWLGTEQTYLTNVKAKHISTLASISLQLFGKQTSISRQLGRVALIPTNEVSDWLPIGLQCTIITDHVIVCSTTIKVAICEHWHNGDQKHMHRFAHQIEKLVKIASSQIAETLLMRCDVT